MKEWGKSAWLKQRKAVLLLIRLGRIDTNTVSYQVTRKQAFFQSHAAAGKCLRDTLNDGCFFPLMHLAGFTTPICYWEYPKANPSYLWQLPTPSKSHLSYPLPQKSQPVQNWSHRPVGPILPIRTPQWDPKPYTWCFPPLACQEPPHGLSGALALDSVSQEITLCQTTNLSPVFFWQLN